jgi:co-chaperonin GroES (HSP10)
MNPSSLIRSLSRVALLAALVAPLGIAISSSIASASPAGAAREAKEGKEKKPRVTVDATFERYVLDAHGHVSALLLKDGSLVHAPEATVRDTSMKAGDALKIEAHAKTTGGVTLYGRALVKKNGTVVVDATKKTEHVKSTGKLAELSATGKISFFLYDRKGAVRGVVLADGTAAHAGKGASLDEYKLKIGDAVTVSGKGGSYALGRALRLESIKLPSGDVKKP